MSTEVFEWKSPGWGPRYRVSIGDSSVAIEKNGRAMSIAIDEIERAYVQPMYAKPTSHMLHVELVDKSGKGVAFHDSGYGPPDSEARACLEAAIAFVRRLVANQANVKLFETSRPDKPARFIMAVIYLLAVVGLLWAFITYVLGYPDRAQGVAFGLSLCFIFGTLWSLRKAARQTPMRPELMLEKLEQLRL